MAVKIRLTRMGRRHRPFFRMNVVDGRTPRDGRIIEKVGHYDPIEKNKDKQYVLDLDRIKFWLDQGAVPSETVAEILMKHGIESKHYQEAKARRSRAREIARKKGVPFTSAERKALNKDAAGEKKA